MTTIDTAPERAAAAPDSPDIRPGGRRAFIMHFIEMLVVMFAGMGILSGVAAMAFAAAGSSLSGQSGELQITLMGINMAIPMVLWMAYRGHPAGRSIEMALAMLVPSIAVAAVVRSDALDVMAGLGIQHVLMVPAMLGVMLWRYDHYAHRHGTPGHGTPANT